jgi:hypothetical protein
MHDLPTLPPSYRGADLLEMFTVFYDPLDYPGRYVVRRFRILHGDAMPDAEPLTVTHSLTAARHAIPDRCDAMLIRSPEDHPSVVETWL